MKNKIIDSSWDFRGENTKQYTHGFHSYPAMMIPQIAERLIKENIGNGEVIMDPFCGSGTVLVESMKANLKSYGIDINPLAILISKVKTTPIDPDKLLRISKELIMKCRFGNNNSYEIPEFNNMDFWFKKNVVKQLAIIKKNIDIYRTQDELYNFFLVAFSETVRKSSNTRSGEFKLYRISENDLKKHNPDAIKLFETRLMKSAEFMKKFYTEFKGNSQPNIFMGDVRREIPIKDKIDLVVTSPPYGDSRTTVAYGQFSRLSLQWLGMQPKEDVDKVSLGGVRYKEIKDIGSDSLGKTLRNISKNNQERAQDVYSFNLDLLECFKSIVKTLSENGIVCFVVGNRTVTGIQIPTDAILAEFGENLGLKHIRTFIRSIPSKRMPLKTSPSNIKGKVGKTITKEHIVILKNS